MPKPRNSRNLKRTDQLLGTLDLRIVGTQYCSAEVAVGENLHLEREHDNQYDPNAIRVANEDFKKVGYIPRSTASWVAALLDAGKIQIAGATATEILPEQQQARMTADVFVTPKGKTVLQPFPECRDEHEALHETVLLAYQQADKWDNPEAIRDLAKRLRSVLDRHSLPETHLILRMFQQKARDVEERRSKSVLESVRRKLRSFRIGKGQHHDGISLFPILAKPNGKSAYLLLQDAPRKKTRIRDRGF